MTLDEIEERLRHWQRRQQELTAAYEALASLTDAMPDCKLFKPIFDVWTAYTVAVSEIIGDRDEWLKWYEFECRMGAHPMEAMLANGRKFKVRTLRQLARLIA